MKQFIIRYFLFIGIMFGLFYFPTTILSAWVNDAQTSLTLSLLGLFLEPGQLQGSDILIHDNYKIIITRACNGMVPVLYLIASVLAFPSTWRRKIIWVTIGYFLFVGVNFLRLLFVIYITKTGEGHADFYWSHDIVGNMMLMGTGLGMFILFVKGAGKENRENKKENRENKKENRENKEGQKATL